MKTKFNEVDKVDDCLFCDVSIIHQCWQRRAFVSGMLRLCAFTCRDSDGAPTAADTGDDNRKQSTPVTARITTTRVGSSFVSVFTHLNHHFSGAHVASCSNMKTGTH